MRRSLSVEETLIRYLRQECLSTAGNTSLAEDTDLFEAGIVDSAGLISFISFVEKEYEITVPDEDLLPQNFSSVARIAHYIRSHRKLHAA